MHGSNISQARDDVVAQALFLRRLEKSIGSNLLKRRCRAFDKQMNGNFPLGLQTISSGDQFLCAASFFDPVSEIHNG